MYKHVFWNVQFIIANKCRSCCVQHTQFKALFQLNYCQTQANCESQSASTSVCQSVCLSASLSVRLSVFLLVCLAIGKCNCNGIGIGSGNVYLALNSEAVFHLLYTLDKPLQEWSMCGLGCSNQCQLQLQLQCDQCELPPTLCERPLNAQLPFTIEQNSNKTSDECCQCCHGNPFLPSLPFSASIQPELNYRTCSLQKRNEKTTTNKMKLKWLLALSLPYAQRSLIGYRSG